MGCGGDLVPFMLNCEDESSVKWLHATSEVLKPWEGSTLTMEFEEDISSML